MLLILPIFLSAMLKILSDYENITDCNVNTYLYTVTLTKVQYGLVVNCIVALRRNITAERRSPAFLFHQSSGEISLFVSTATLDITGVLPSNG